MKRYFFVCQAILGIVVTAVRAAPAPLVKDAVQLAAAKSAAISPDGKIIVTGTYQKIGIWDAAGGKSLGQLEYKDGEVYHLIFSRDGSLLVAGGVLKKTLTVFDVKSRQVLATIKPPGELDIVPIGFTEDAKYLIAGGPKEITILSLTDGSVIKSIPISGKIESFVLLEGAKEVVTIGNFDGKLTAWDLKTGQASMRQFKQGKDSTPSLSPVLSLAGTGKIAVASFMDQRIFVFDCGTGSLVHKVADVSLRRAGFTRDGKTFAHGTWNTTAENFVAVGDVGSGKIHTRIGPFGKETVFSSALLSPDGKTLVAVPNEGVSPVLVWHLK